MTKKILSIFLLILLGVSLYAFKFDLHQKHSHHTQKSFSKLSTDNLLAISWQNAFCQTHQNKRECRNVKPDHFSASHFTLHGLWPQPRNRVNCRGSRKVRLSSDLYHELLQVMPAAKSGLQNHEWKKHGTCYGKDQQGYFGDAISLIKQINRSKVRDLFAKNVGKTLSVDQVRRAVDESFGKGVGRKVKMVCKNGLITELWFNLKGKITPSTPLGSLLKSAKRAKGGCKRGKVDRVGF
jgi:ribonuclease T2